MGAAGGIGRRLASSNPRGRVVAPCAQPAAHHPWYCQLAALVALQEADFRRASPNPYPGQVEAYIAANMTGPAFSDSFTEEGCVVSPVPTSSASNLRPLVQRLTHAPLCRISTSSCATRSSVLLYSARCKAAGPGTAVRLNVTRITSYTWRLHALALRCGVPSRALGGEGDRGSQPHLAMQRCRSVLSSFFGCLVVSPPCCSGSTQSTYVSVCVPVPVNDASCAVAAGGLSTVCMFVLAQRTATCRQCRSMPIVLPMRTAARAPPTRSRTSKLARRRGRLLRRALGCCRGAD